MPIGRKYRITVARVRESCQNALASIRAIGARLERGFANFADIP
jgi:hypothetical protein